MKKKILKKLFYSLALSLLYISTYSLSGNLSESENNIVSEINYNLIAIKEGKPQDQALLLLSFFLKKKQPEIKEDSLKSLVIAMQESIQTKNFDYTYFKNCLNRITLKSDTCNKCDRHINKEWISSHSCGHIICYECLTEKSQCPLCPTDEPCTSRQIEEQNPHKQSPIDSLIAREHRKACPGCNTVYEYIGEGFMICTLCNMQSCPSCETQHDGQSCSEYYQSLNPDEKRNLVITKFCILEDDDSNTPEKDCAVCYTPIPAKEHVALACEHALCADCLKQYIDTTENMSSDGGLYTISCPENDCNTVLPRSILQLIFPSGKQLQKSLNIFVTEGRGFFCPAGCNAVILKETVDEYLKNPAPFTCNECHKTSCLACSTYPYHTKKTCEQNAHQNKKNLKLLKKLNAQKCPQCQALATKTACNRVRCSCGYHFCWKCLKPWKGYTKNGLYSVNCGCYIWAKLRDPAVTQQDLKGNVNNPDPIINKKETAEQPIAGQKKKNILTKILPWKKKR